MWGDSLKTILSGRSRPRGESCQVPPQMVKLQLNITLARDCLPVCLLWSRNWGGQYFERFANPSLQESKPFIQGVALQLHGRFYGIINTGIAGESSYLKLTNVLRADLLLYRCVKMLPTARGQPR